MTARETRGKLIAMAVHRAKVIQDAADAAVHTLPATVWSAMSFEDIRAHVRRSMPDTSDDDLRAALAELEGEGRAYPLPQSEPERQRDPDGWYGPGQIASYEIEELPELNGGLVLQLVVGKRVMRPINARSKFSQPRILTTTISSCATS